MKKLLLIGLIFLVVNYVVYAEPSNGIFTYHSFDSGPGNIAGTGYNYTNTGATLVAGRVSNCYDFEQTEHDYLTRATDYPDFDTWGKFSVNIWLKPESFSDSGEWFESFTANKFQIHQAASATLTTYHWDTAYRTMTTTLTTGNWQMITYVWNGSKAFLYKNATYINSVNVASNGAAAGVNHIAADQGVAHWLDGLIDEVGVWNRALTSTEITQLYKGGVGCNAYNHACDTAIPNMTVTLTYPTNKSTYYNGAYNGSILLTLANVNGSASCYLSDSRFTRVGSLLKGNGTYGFINNTAFNTIQNVSMTFRCNDTKPTVINRSLWFYLDSNLTVDLEYPVNETTYYGSYNGSIILNFTNNWGNVSCSVNDTLWTYDGNDGSKISLINNTVLSNGNYSLEYSCQDVSGGNTSSIFWFYVDNMAVFNLYDQRSNLFLDRINASFTLESVSFSNNYSFINGTSTIYSLTPGDYTLYTSISGYSPVVYYFTVYPNTYHTINIYLLNSSYAYLIIISVYDQDGREQTGIKTTLLRHNTATNTYLAVSNGITNTMGQVAQYVELYTINYKVMFSNSAGSLLLLTNPYPFTSEYPVFKLDLIESPYLGWANINDIVYNLSYINSSGQMYARLVYLDSRSVVRTGCLRVDSISLSDGYLNICDNCTNSAAATLTCKINGTAGIGITYKAVARFDTNTANSWFTTAVEWYINQSVPDLGITGRLWAFIMIGTGIFVGISTATGSVVMLILSVILVGVLGLMKGVNLAFIFYVGISAIIVLFLTRRSGGNL